MAAATITKTDYGYVATGGVDATTVDSGNAVLWVKAIYFSGNADNATATITTLENVGGVDTATSAGKFKCSDTTELSSTTGNVMWFGESGSPLRGLAVTLGNTASHLYIHLANK